MVVEFPVFTLDKVSTWQMLVVTPSDTFVQCAWTLLDAAPAALLGALAAGIGGRRRCWGRKKLGESDFSTSIYSCDHFSGAFHSGCHISFPAVRVLRVRAWAMWGSRSAAVIYGGGLRLYLFSISLMLGSGFTPALPWPTGRQGLGGDPSGKKKQKTCSGISATDSHMHSQSHIFLYLIPFKV